MATQNHSGHRSSNPQHAALREAVARLCQEGHAMQHVLTEFARLVLERVSDLVSIDLVEDDGSIRRYLTLHADESVAAKLSTDRKEYPLSPTASYGYPRVIKTGKSQFIPGVTPHQAYRLLSSAKPETQSGLTVRSFICVPLVAHGRTLGAITVANTEKTAVFTADDLLLLEELADLLADCLDSLL